MITLRDVVDILVPDSEPYSHRKYNDMVTAFAISLNEVRPGAVFFALSQPDFKKNGFNSDPGDTNPHIPTAFKKGALICVTRADCYAKYNCLLSQYREQIVIVDDVIASLQKLAREMFVTKQIPVVGITGSAGKTTTKEITGHILRAANRRVLLSRLNRNNGLGIPLAVLELCFDKSFELAVLEMGMSTPQDEIAKLCKISPPDISVLLNVLPVHLQYLGSIEAILQAKIQIFENMRPGGVAILNADDPLLSPLKIARAREVVSFGLSSGASVTAKNVKYDKYTSSFELITPAGKVDINSQLLGFHNVANMLAAAAISHSLGVALDLTAAALGDFQATKQRGEVIEIANGISLIDDSYNSNPHSLGQVVKAVSHAAERRKVVLILGDMLELGIFSERMHRELGDQIALPNVRLVVGVGKFIEALLRSVEENSKIPVAWYADSASVVENISEILEPNDVVLVKGSHGMRLDRVISFLTSPKK
jgi:UDP-N-acetylmuramoyl-tripeptide--D-alanyl-D-alanine ligase